MQQVEKVTDLRARVDEINPLVINELKRAAEKHGEKFNSRHEAFGVLMEELEEATLSHSLLQQCLIKYWDSVKKDEKDIAGKLDEIKLQAILLAVESIQIAAMACKAQVLEENRKEK